MVECYSVIKNRKGMLIMAVNMVLNQLVIQERIPFEVKLNPFSYTSHEVIREVETTLAMEGMKLDDNDIQMLQAYEDGSVSGDELREQIINEAQNGIKTPWYNRF